MKRYCFYIDGFNVYYALQSKKYYHKYKWLDYRKLAESVIKAKDTISGIYLFTALVHWKPDSVKRHEDYIKVLRSVGVEFSEEKQAVPFVQWFIYNARREAE